MFDNFTKSTNQRFKEMLFSKADNQEALQLANELLKRKVFSKKQVVVCCMLARGEIKPTVSNEV